MRNKKAKKSEKHNNEILVECKIQKTMYETKNHVANSNVKLKKRKQKSESEKNLSKLSSFDLRAAR